MTIKVEVFEYSDQAGQGARITRDSGRGEPDVLLADGTWWNVLDTQGGESMRGSAYALPDGCSHRVARSRWN